MHKNMVKLGAVRSMPWATLTFCALFKVVNMPALWFLSSSSNLKPPAILCPFPLMWEFTASCSFQVARHDKIHAQVPLGPRYDISTRRYLPLAETKLAKTAIYWTGLEHRNTAAHRMVTRCMATAAMHLVLVQSRRNTSSLPHSEIYILYWKHHQNLTLYNPEPGSPTSGPVPSGPQWAGGRFKKHSGGTGDALWETLMAEG